MSETDFNVCLLAMISMLGLLSWVVRDTQNRVDCLEREMNRKTKP